MVAIEAFRKPASLSDEFKIADAEGVAGVGLEPEDAQEPNEGVEPGPGDLPAAAGGGVKQSQKAARELLAERRKKCTNHMQYSAKVLASHAACAACDGMEFTTRKPETAFNEQMEN